MEATKAIIRKPGKRYTSCITSHPLGHTVSLEKALLQHEEYCKVLVELGLEVIELPPKDEFPDACFVEDNAVVFKNKAFITRMGVESRRGEENEVKECLKDYFQVKEATEPATIEGGDVIHFEDRLICGVSQRTNQHGVNQMQDWLDVRVDTITNPWIVHLKSYMKNLGNNTLITTEAYEHHKLLKGLKLLLVKKEEYYSVNCLAVSESVVMSDKFAFAQKIVKDAGFDVITLDMSEFEKCQASLTCLSILF